MQRQSRISVNCHGQNILNEGRLLDFLQKLNPVSVLVMDNLDLAARIRAILPECIVIHRNYGITNSDEGLHERISPELWMTLRAGESLGRGIWLYVENEPAFTQAVIDWHVRLAQLAIQRNVKLVLGNWSTGNPEPDNWKLARPLLDLLAAHPDKLILGLHEYGGGVLASGLYGGYPNHAGVQPGQGGGIDLTVPDNWPEANGMRRFGKPDAVTAFHVGRFRFLQNYCESVGIKPPRIIITEHGIDDVSDIGGWLKDLTVSAGYQNIRGWKTLTQQWRNWWYQSKGWTPERAYFEQLAWADRAIYSANGSPVEAQLIYCYGHSSAIWDQFDVAQADELLNALVANVVSLPPIVEPPPIVIPPPTPTPTHPYLKISLPDNTPDSVIQFLKSNRLEVTYEES